MSESNTNSTQSLGAVYTKLRQISEKAKSERSLCFTSLAHLMTVDLLRASFERLRKDAAAGIDGMTWQEYGAGYEARLRELHTRLREGCYRAQPVRRVYIEKSDGKQRPLGIPALEDKLVQRAMVTVLEAIYEQDFHPFSYGFRPGRGAHDALDAINTMCYQGRVNYIIDADIRSYFDSVVHAHLREFLHRRIADRNIHRLIGKWLHCGVLEEGRLLASQVGTPQGSVISPLLANIYLHYVLDEWWVNDVIPCMYGHAEIVRYADDFILGFARKEDAERVMRSLPKRFACYGLELHPSKTRLIPFNKWLAKRERERGGSPTTFNFLGFTHYFGKSRKGNYTYRVSTIGSRLTRSLRNVKAWCRRYRHLPVPKQQERLCRVLMGHYNYYGRSTNFRRLRQFYIGVRRLWHKWLGRRGGRKPFSYEKFHLMLQRLPLPPPRITHRLLSLSP